MSCHCEISKFLIVINFILILTDNLALTVAFLITLRPVESMTRVVMLKLHEKCAIKSCEQLSEQKYTKLFE